MQGEPHSHGKRGCPPNRTAHHFVQTPAIQIRGLWFFKDLLFLKTWRIF